MANKDNTKDSTKTDKEVIRDIARELHKTTNLMKDIVHLYLIEIEDELKSTYTSEQWEIMEKLSNLRQVNTSIELGDFDDVADVLNKIRITLR